MEKFCENCGGNHVVEQCPDNTYYMTNQRWSQQQNFSWYDQTPQNSFNHDYFDVTEQLPRQQMPQQPQHQPLGQARTRTTREYMQEAMRKLGNFCLNCGRDHVCDECPEYAEEYGITENYNLP